MALPEKFLKNMQEILSAENYQNYLDSFSCDRYYGLRVNTSKISVEDFLKISPFELKPVSWCKEGFYYDGKKKDLLNIRIITQGYITFKNHRQCIRLVY